MYSVQTLFNSPIDHIHKVELFQAMKEDGHTDGKLFLLVWDVTGVKLVKDIWRWDENYFCSEYEFFLKNGRVRTKKERQMEYLGIKKSTTTLPRSGWDLSKEGPVPKWTIDEIVDGRRNYFDPFQLDPVVTVCAPQQVKTNGEDPMYFHFDTRTPLEQQQVEFAFNYADKAYCEALGNLAKKYHIHDDPAPKDAEEFIDRIKNGKYTLLDKETDGRWRQEFDYEDGYGTPRRLVWRDPANVKDTDGYHAAEETLRDEYMKLKTVIMAGDYKASIAAVNEFAKKYTVH